jgi:hypothetical protein
MSDSTLLVEKLEQIEEAFSRIKRRFPGIHSSDDFLYTPEGVDKLDAISMMLIAVCETFKKIDAETNGTLLSQY